jgi:peptide/nickel transport system permease protein
MQDERTALEAVLRGSQTGEGVVDGRPPAADSFEVPLKQLGQWTMVWRRFTQHRLAVLGGWILLAVVVLAVAGPSIAPSITHQPTDFIQQYNRGQPPQLWPPNLDRLMGTDWSTNPVSGYVLAGARPAMIIGLLGALIASTIGILIGATAGYFGRAVDTLLMRLTDAVLIVPFYPLLLLLRDYVPATYASSLDLAVLCGLVGWGGVSRLVRGYLLSLREREFADAARALGASDLGIMFRHLLPNAMDVLIVSFSLNIALFMVTAANLGEIGPWGAAMGQFNYEARNWWQIVFPAICLLLAITSVNLLGDGLRDALDTSSTSHLIRWKARPVRDRWVQGRWLVGRFIGPAARPVFAVMSTMAAAAATLRARPGRPRSAWEHVEPAPRRSDTVPGVARLTLQIERLPIAVRLLPPLVTILAGMAVFLYAHSPLRYSAHFTSPVPLVTEEENTDYGVHALKHGAWAVFAGDSRGGLTFTKVDANGKPLVSQRIATGGSNASLATRHGWSLGVWLSPDTSTVMAAYLGKHRTRPFALVPRSGLVDHPYVTRAPGGFAVVFQWQRTPNQRAEYQIYLAYLRQGATHPAAIRRIGASAVYGLYPRAVTDGSGLLDVLYLDHTAKRNIWNVALTRVHPDGNVVDRPRPIGVVCFRCLSLSEIVPPRWAIDLKRVRDGSVWALWDATQGLSDILYAAHWDQHGRQVLPPTPLISAGFESPPASTASLSLFAGGGQVYYTGPNPDGGVTSVTWMQAFDDRGRLAGAPQRVNYDAAGASSLPRAGTVGGQPVVVWARVRAGPTFLEASRYHARATPPDLVTRFGLNVGNVWLNIGLVLVGALAGGIGIATINSLLVLAAVLLWLVIGRVLPSSLRWPACFLLIAALMGDIFGRNDPRLTPWVFVISGLGSPQNWVAVATSIVVSAWTGFFLVRRFEPVFRAASAAFAALYVVAVMYAVIFIQSELTRI